MAKDSYVKLSNGIGDDPANDEEQYQDFSGGDGEEGGRSSAGCGGSYGAKMSKNMAQSDKSRHHGKGRG